MGKRKNQDGRRPAQGQAAVGGRAGCTGWGSGALPQGTGEASGRGRGERSVHAHAHAAPSMLPQLHAGAVMEKEKLRGKGELREERKAEF